MQANTKRFGSSAATSFSVNLHSYLEHFLLLKLENGTIRDDLLVFFLSFFSAYLRIALDFLQQRTVDNHS